MKDQIEICAEFKRMQEMAAELGLTIRVEKCFDVMDCGGIVVMKAPTIESLYYILYGWDKCFAKYVDRIVPC